jgi:hypothetical protein
VRCTLFLGEKEIWRKKKEEEIPCEEVEEGDKVLERFK